MITILAIYRNLIFVISNSATVYLCVCVCVRACARAYIQVSTQRVTTLRKLLLLVIFSQPATLV